MLFIIHFHIVVFSAQAEVFLCYYANTKEEFGFLRASGGVSKSPFAKISVHWFSPRKRRCF